MTTTRARRRRPKVRLLWDENLSVLVPRALRVLDHRVIHVGADEFGVPPKGSTDRNIVQYAQQTNQVIVTINHDMMTICADAGQRFVWLDPRGRSLSREAQVLLVFNQIHEWQQILDRLSGACVRAMRTKCVAIDPAEAARMATNRMREINRRKSSRSRRWAGSAQEQALEGM